MDRRLLLQALLEEILGSDKVYFQPHSDIQMAYPAIVYSRDYAETTFADNRPFLHEKRYLVTVIHRDPDNPVYDRLAMLPKCVFVRSFVADNLHHDLFNIFF